MRTRLWRRIAATLALLVGLGLAAPVASASAAAPSSASIANPAGGVAAPSSVHGKVPFDWWWGP